MRILAIDPGYERLGIAVLEKNRGDRKETLLFSECFKTKTTNTHAERLLFLGQEISKIIKKYKPEALAIETLFLTTNHKTVMLVSETRGVILYEGARHNLSIHEFSPPQIKSAVAGDGHCDKKAIIKMIPLLINLDKEIKHDDEYDAIAVGLTFFAYNKDNKFKV
jgi:crossover junction endodeoxyribonuclease RuvC